MCVLVVQGKRLVSQHDFHFFCLAGLQGKLLQAFELCVRCVVPKRLDIDLNGLSACKFSGIFYGSFDPDLSACLDLHTVCPRLSLFKGGVGKAEAEGIKRVLFHVAVGASLHRIVGELRQLLRGAVERYRQLALRAVFSENRLCDSFSACRAGIPCLQDCLAVRILPFQRHCGAGH